jgi:3-(3-hydroxy-phenyl)propionate hydroxylase
MPAESALARAWEADLGDAWLIRPDLHIAGRWKDADPAKIRACLGHILEQAA